MNIGSIMSPFLVSAQAGETMLNIVGRLRFNDVGAVAVYEDGTFAGILTERDVIRALDDGFDPAEVTVGEWMTRAPVSVTPETDIEEVARDMLELGVRHFPVVDGDEIQGMISIRDVLASLMWTARR